MTKIKLSKLYKSLLLENNSIPTSVESELKDVGKSLSNDKKIQSIVLNAFKKNPKSFEALEKKLGKLLPTNEDNSDFNINFNNLEKLSLDLSKDIDIELEESLKDTLKISLKVLKLLGISGIDDLITIILKDILQGELIDIISAESSGTINSVALIITIATVILKIIRNAKSNNLKSAI